MKKEFWEQYTIGDDDILTDNFTGERMWFYVDPATNEVKFIPEAEYKEELKKKNKGVMASLCQSLRKFLKPVYA
ncbi:hypothetical protein [Sulfurospirillum oryzae]|uniref:hypothetical protein n=1 Tax=Sulfurospirillum oryzae TaxID=2976535 RepID=UPI0021E855C2|nr:hypothetical protein [Sulfurospirillum oryzae]